MKQLLLIYHSQSGRNERLAEQLYLGARQGGEVQVQLLRSVDVELGHLQRADGVVLLGAENFGLPNGMMLDCLARQFYCAGESLAGIPYAVVMSTGNGGAGALRYLERFLGAMGMRECQPALVFHGELGAQHERECRDMGEAFGAALAMGIY